MKQNVHLITAIIMATGCCAMACNQAPPRQPKKPLQQLQGPIRRNTILMARYRKRNGQRPCTMNDNNGQAHDKTKPTATISLPYTYEIAAELDNWFHAN